MTTGTIVQRLDQAASKADAASEQMRKFVNGTEAEDVATESGPMPTMRKFMAEVRAEIIGDAGVRLGQEILDRQAADTELQGQIDTKATPSDISAAVNGLVDGAPADRNTLGKIATQLATDEGLISGNTAALALRVRVDADQSLTTAQQLQARQNINAEQVGVAQALVDAITPTVNAATGGQRPFATLSALNAYSGSDKANFLATVTNDATASNNGVYSWTGAAWTKSAYDPATVAINDRKALIDNSQQTDDGIYLLNPLRAALISLHTSTGMRIPGAGIDLTPTALAVSGLGLSVAGSKATFGNVGLEITEDGRAAAVVVGKFGQVIYDSRTSQSQSTTPTPSSVVTTTALQGLLADLGNPLQSVVVTAIGDSICWGIGAAGTATATPRNKTLADPRNNYTSGSYINLLRRWLGMMAGAQTGDPAELVAGFSPANADPNKYSGFAGYRVPQFCNLDTRITKSTGCTVAVDTYALSGRALDIPVGGYASITVYGDSVDVLWKSQSAATTSTFTLECNGTDTQTINTYSATLVHNNVASATAPSFGTNTFKIVNTGSYPLRVQGIRHNRLIALRNNGLSGSTTVTWLPTASPVILSDAVPADTTHLLVKLGTNDRGVKGVTNLTDNLKSIIAWIQANRPAVKISLSAPPKAAPEFDFPGNAAYYYSTGTARDAVYRVATELGLSFVDFYAATASYELIAGSTTSYLDDGLHPNDTGYAEMFRTFTQTITSA